MIAQAFGKHADDVRIAGPKIDEGTLQVFSRIDMASLFRQHLL
jgi:hypothetical protein